MIGTSFRIDQNPQGGFAQALPKERGRDFRVGTSGPARKLRTAGQTALWLVY